MADRYELRLPALALQQGSRVIYTFGVDGKRLHDFATVSRVSREHGTLQGYQRPEVLNHIRAIRRYLESDGAMLPNAIVLAFDGRVRFEPYRRRAIVNYSTPGDLVIPVDESLEDSQKPALLVDGQQRAAAIRDADVVEFPVAGVGFIASDEEEQRSQFILVNSTKPLPKGLIHELLPDTAAYLPPQYARKRLPAYLMMRLNVDHDSPFCGLIATPTAPEGYIKDNSVLKMIENSLYEGAIYQYRDSVTGGGDVEQMLLHLKYYWTVVAHQWPDAWALPPRKSRLTHGVGIQSLGFIMDALTDGSVAADLPGLDLDRSLTSISQISAWTGGAWQLAEDDTRRWNGLQNTPNDVRLLTNVLIQCVKGRS
jgi:DGQHR domain-containing protein